MSKNSLYGNGVKKCAFRNGSKKEKYLCILDRYFLMKSYVSEMSEIYVKKEQLKCQTAEWLVL